MGDPRVTEAERKEAVELVSRLAHLAGCCLHCVVDDNNDSDGFLAIYRDEDMKHPDCRRLLVLLRKMKRTQRRKVCRQGYDKAAGRG